MLNTPDSRSQADNDALRAAMAVVIFAMASLAETRDSDSSNHILRIQHYVTTLARHLQGHARFAPLLTDSYIETLFQSAPLYDMGTIGVADRILLKPSRLSPEEFAIMQTHTSLARDAIDSAEKTLGYAGDLLRTLKEFAYSHQEKWDGSGYPQGLSGEQIPFAARLIAIADVYDALITDRVYKAGVPHDQAVAVIFQGRASHFDPELVDAFIEVHHEFAAIAQRFPDSDQDMQKKIEYLAHAIAEEAE
jgi:putative two-component system response regulator